jgi:hypothetical protein
VSGKANGGGEREIPSRKIHLRNTARQSEGGMATASAAVSQPRRAPAVSSQPQGVSGKPGASPSTSSGPASARRGSTPKTSIIVTAAVAASIGKRADRQRDRRLNLSVQGHADCRPTWPPKCESCYANAPTTALKNCGGRGVAGRCAVSAAVGASYMRRASSLGKPRRRRKQAYKSLNHHWFRNCRHIRNSWNSCSVLLAERTPSDATAWPAGAPLLLGVLCCACTG